MSTPSLHWQGPDGQDNVFTLTGKEVLIGRKGDSDVILSNQHVSRHHAKIVKMEEGYFLLDLASTHGTYVNNQRIQQHILNHGDTIGLGKDRIELRYVAAEGRPLRPPKPPTSQFLERSMIDLGKVLPSEQSDLEKISYILDFQYQWEQLFTPETAFQKILESTLKISGAERGFILIRDEEKKFGYAAGLDGNGRKLSLSHFQ